MWGPRKGLLLWGECRKLQEGGSRQPTRGGRGSGEKGPRDGAGGLMGASQVSDPLGKVGSVVQSPPPTVLALRRWHDKNGHCFECLTTMYSLLFTQSSRRCFLNPVRCKEQPSSGEVTDRPQVAKLLGGLGVHPEPHL